MATRVTLPSPRRAIIEIPPRSWIVRWERLRDWQPPRGKALHRALYRTITLPYWLASDIPAPHLPALDRKPPAAGLAGDQVVRNLNRIARRVWLQRALGLMVRSVWLGLLAACVWLMVDIQGGPAFEERRLPWLIGAFLVPGLIFALLVRPTRRQVARMLDRSFGLQERMVTAVDNLGKAVPKPGERPSLVYLQMADAANVVEAFRRHPAFAITLPVREIVLVITTALLLASLYFMRGVGGDVPPTQAGAVPPFKPASERLLQPPVDPSGATTQQDVPTLQEVEQRAQRSNEARQDLARLAEAMRDHAVTSDAAEAIERGEYSEAANDLRELAEHADRLSPASREQLAQDLEAAASDMSEGSQQLADATRQSAEGLRQGGEPAKEGLRELGDAVEQTGKEVVSQQELAQQMEQARAAQRRNSGASGDASSSEPQLGDAGSDQQAGGQSGEQQGSEPGQAGEGADAEPGQNASSDQAGQQDGSATDGSTGPSRRQVTQGQATNGQAQDPGQEAGGQPGQAGDPGNQGASGTESESGAASQGSDAGANGSDQSSAAQQNGQQPQNGTTGGEGAPSEEQVSSQDVPDGQGRDAQTDPREAITLSRAPEGESVQTGGSSGGSNAGSGPGVAISGGTATQGEVGVAGPDSNRVPPAYRSIVEAYFSESDQ